MHNKPPVDTSLSAMQSLLQLYDKNFVIKAYETILGRSPDQSGMQHYLAQVRSGVAKEELIAELIRSPEGQIRATEVPALKQYIDKYPGRVNLFLSRVFRRFVGATSKKDEQCARALENRLFLMEQRIASNAQLIEDIHLLLWQRISVDQSRITVDGDKAGPEVQVIGAQLRQNSLDIARTVVELKAAIAAKRRR